MSFILCSHPVKIERRLYSALAHVTNSALKWMLGGGGLTPFIGLE